jgi:hypothetical protein
MCEPQPDERARGDRCHGESVRCRGCIESLKKNTVLTHRLVTHLKALKGTDLNKSDPLFRVVHATSGITSTFVSHQDLLVSQRKQCCGPPRIQQALPQLHLQQPSAAGKLCRFVLARGARGGQHLLQWSRSAPVPVLELGQLEQQRQPAKCNGQSRWARLSAISDVYDQFHVRRSKSAYRSLRPDAERSYDVVPAISV